MPPSRRERLEAMLAEMPDDQELRYAVAMELHSEGRTDDALAAMQRLMHDATPYVPAFFRTAQWLIPLGRIPEARSALRDGIEQARRQGRTKDAAEMSELLMELGHAG